MTQYMEGYVVVCKQFHGSRGLYRTIEEAERIRDEHNRSEPCEYVVVPCQISLARFMN